MKATARIDWIQATDFIMRRTVTVPIDSDGNEIAIPPDHVLLIPVGWTWYMAGTGRTIGCPFKPGDIVQSHMIKTDGQDGPIATYRLISKAWFRRQSYAGTTPGDLIDRCMIAEPVL